MTDLILLLLAEDKYLLHVGLCGQLAQIRRGVVAPGEYGLAGAVVSHAEALVGHRKYTEAEGMVRHVSEIRQAAYPQGDWRTAHVMSLLGASLTGQGKYTEAEPLLLDAYNQMKASAETIPADLREARLHEALERIVKLYEAWDAAELGKGYADKATEYRAMLSQDDG
jgi:hypothetical protein